MPVIDPSALENMTGGDHELLADLATMFVQLLPDIEARLRIAIENRDTEEIGMVAHQLRSRVSYFGATDLQNRAKNIELMAKQGDFIEIAKSCQQMLTGIDDLLVELRTLTRLSLEKSDD
ncbi:MAG: Hpt domain-containing protein [Pirellulaceae bacterium]|nr:Hpt domain-containing protein [Pirellulaceae bacterium]